MTGHAYTMREMKTIVEYLVQQKAYKEIRGRKMWMDFANSNLTNRTWQSLKETFLKRILPDITNPYYKLTVQQISSFRQGCDLEARKNNKLEIHTINDDSSSNDTLNQDPQPSNSKNTKHGNNTGEKGAVIEQNRSSTDTVVIGTCYKTAEKIQNDLESPAGDSEREKSVSPTPASTKSIRDYITYTEPLTPMLQEVLHDFASDDDGEPLMQIVEDQESGDNASPTPVDLVETEIHEGEKETEHVDESETIYDETNNKITENSNIISQKSKSLNDNVRGSMNGSDDIQYIDDSEKFTEHSTNKEVNGANLTDMEPNLPKNSNDKTSNLTKSQNNSDTTIDTLPNNQEAFKQLVKPDDNSLNEKSSQNLPLNKNTNDLRNRSKSEEIQSVRPKKRINDEKATDADLAIKGNRKNISKSGTKRSRTHLTHPTGSNDENVISTGKISESRQNGENINKSNENISNNIASEIKQNQYTPPDVDSEIPLTFRSHREDSKKRQKAKAVKQRNYIEKVTNEVAIQNAQSDSTHDQSNISVKKHKASHHSPQKVHKNRVLANVFGFSSGLKSNQKKHKKNRRRSPSLPRILDTSSSSEWTSDTGSEYISPPRGRKNRQTRKYLKPKSVRVLSLEEEGGLFVVYGKKIYPVVKDGKIVKNYLTLTQDNNSEDEEQSYWKLKYVEEKKKTDELTKILKQNETKETVPAEPEEVPVVMNVESKELPSSKMSSVSRDVCKDENDEKSEHTEPSSKEPETKKEAAGETENVKIKFIQHNKAFQEVQLEGHWSRIHPVLEQVVQTLHIEPQPQTSRPASRLQATEYSRKSREASVQTGYSTRDSTPISMQPQYTIDPDEYFLEKLNEREEEIRKLIEERDDAEIMAKEPINTNVTKRKVGRPRLRPASAEQSPAAPRRKPPQPAAAVQTRKRGAPPKEQQHEPPELATNEPKRVKRNSRKTVVSVDEDDDVKYKLADEPPAAVEDGVGGRKSNSRTPRKRTPKRRYPVKGAKIFSSPDNISNSSIESSSGYRDTDASNQSIICLKRKREPRLKILNKGKGKTLRVPVREKTQHQERENVTSDSNISFVTAQVQSSSQPNSSSNTEVYRSESYEMLMPRRKETVQHLDKIDESSPTINDVKYLNNNGYDNSATKVLAVKKSYSSNERNTVSPDLVHSEENSSHMSLPPSPVFSIVEKISLSQIDLDNADIDIPDNATQEMKQTTLNKYMSSDVDMSVPLMEREYSLQKKQRDETECHYDLNTQEVSQDISESLLNKVCAVNITEPTLSESIHIKIKNLVLESAKKIALQINNNKNNKETIDKMEICEPGTQRKSKSKKRCSTPRKRQSKRKTPANNVGPQIEDEHIESYGNGQTRAPPAVIVTQATPDHSENDTPTTNINKEPRRAEKLRKRKDVIKVKIIKPTRKGYSSDSAAHRETKASFQVDSGINDTESGIFLRGLDDSVDLIHNHSDTCLHAHECVGDSVEIIGDNANPAISLNSSNELPNQSASASSTPIINGINKLLDLCCENAQDCANLHIASEVRQGKSNENYGIFNTSTDNISVANSLITDDLSEESPPRSTAQNRVTKWYLLSEDEASNTINFDTKMTNINVGYGSNLQEIFPITCAVPDLSTITEENTAKFNFESDSQSLPGNIKK